MPLDGEPVKKRRHVRFKQSDLERAIRAAQATGAQVVVVRPDGSIVVELTREHGKDKTSEPDEAFALW